MSYSQTIATRAAQQAANPYITAAVPGGGQALTTTEISVEMDASADAVPIADQFYASTLVITVQNISGATQLRCGLAWTDGTTPQRITPMRNLQIDLDGDISGGVSTTGTVTALINAYYVRPLEAGSPIGTQGSVFLQVRTDAGTCTLTRARLTWVGRYNIDPDRYPLGQNVGGS